MDLKILNFRVTQEVIKKSFSGDQEWLIYIKLKVSQCNFKDFRNK